MFFRTSRTNTQRARVLHYLRVKALEHVFEEGGSFHKGLETGEIRFGSDNQDVPFINARYAVRGLELLASRVAFYEEVSSVSDIVVTRHLHWFLDQLASAALYAKNQQNQESQAAAFEAAAQFVYELLHPKPAAPVVSLTWADDGWKSG